MSGNILEVSGRYDLGAAIRFLEGWPPTAGENRQRSTLRWSMCLESSWEPIGVTAVQGADGIEFEYVGSADQDDVAVHVARVLSLDVDARGFDDVGDRDPIAGSILADFPGLRPVCFWTPYEAAVWGVISQRSSRVTASRVKKHMARELGDRIGDGYAFPGPSRLEQLESFPGLPQVKIERLRAVAGAALAGRLDSRRLRSSGVEETLARLREIEGVGPFTAELILVRGAGHPDVFPRHEHRLHRAMRSAYGLTDASVNTLAVRAEHWSPYRSWVSFLFRVQAAG
ncbi:MAG: DNA-3-methyladenine glycosylase 2 family protein [Acidimicrobiia bacterium]